VNIIELQRVILSALGFLEKVKTGKAQAAGSGFGGKGLDRLDKERDAKEKAERKAYGEGGEEKVDEKAEEVMAKPLAATDDMTFGNFKVEIKRGPAPDASRVLSRSKDDEKRIASSLRAAEEAAARAGKDTAAYRQAQSVVAKLNAQVRASKLMISAHPSDGSKKDPDATDFHAIVPINDYPQKARWRVTNKETMVQVGGCSLFSGVLTITYRFSVDRHDRCFGDEQR
jgi:ATP-dependent RNA helicase DDX46/PRP5